MAIQITHYTIISKFSIRTINMEADLETRTIFLSMETPPFNASDFDDRIVIRWFDQWSWQEPCCPPMLLR